MYSRGYSWIRIFRSLLSWDRVVTTDELSDYNRPDLSFIVKKKYNAIIIDDSIQSTHDFKKTKLSNTGLRYNKVSRLL